MDGHPTFTCNRVGCWPHPRPMRAPTRKLHKGRGQRVGGVRDKNVADGPHDRFSSDRGYRDVLKVKVEAVSDLLDTK